MRWDVFCKVIDNHGDAGVCWRLAAELARRGEHVRLWIDRPQLLAWMAPGGQPGVEVVPWGADAPVREPHDVVIEAFGCDPPPAFVAAMAARQPRPPVWLNLEYLSAEDYVERSHGLPSPVAAGPGAGLTKHFFYPGFTARTGGLLREADLAARQAAFDRSAWLAGHGIEADRRLISLFCYEPEPLPRLLRQLAGGPPTQLLVTAGRATDAVRNALVALERDLADWNATGRLHLHFLPLLSQREYDHLLWACDLNFVRGEDSVVRALLAGKPLVWQIYPQDDGAHWAKLEAFLDRLAAPASLRTLHRQWNGAANEDGLVELDLSGWTPAARQAAATASGLPELAAELTAFARERLE